MIDFTPLARLSVLAIAGVLVVVPLAVASLFVRVEMWWALPAIAVAYMGLRLTAFKD